MKNQILPIVFFLLASVSLTAQDDWKCGTVPVRLLSDVQKNITSKGNGDTATLYIPITIHIVGKDDGTGYFSLSQTMKSLCDLQTDFAPYHFWFYLDTVRYLNHSAFNVWDGWGLEMLSVLDSQNVHNTLNIYVVQGVGSSFVVWYDTLDLSVPPLMFNPQQHAVLLAKEHLTTRTHTIAHEVGHYFGLWHTFNGWDGLDFGSFPGGVPDTLHTTYTYNGIVYDWDIPVERADSVDCASAADYLCDTPPDYLSFSFICDANQQSNIVQTDPNGIPFRTDGSFFMSYSQDICQSRFSPGQVAWMRAVAQGPRDYLLYNQTPPAPFSPSVWEMIYPPDNETVAISDSITLEWEEDIPGADFTLLEFGRVVNPVWYVPIVNDVLPNKNTFKVRVYPQLNYYWIVKAVNRYYPCQVVADTSYFSTTLVSAHESLPSNLLQLYPNPASSRLYWRLPEFVATPQNISIQVFDAQGRQQQCQSLPSGQALDVQGLTPGMYTLKVVAGERVYVGKFVKQ